MRSLVVSALCVFGMASTSSATMATDNGVICHALMNPIKMATRLCLCQPCHICELKFDGRNSTCQLITSHNPDVMDGYERTSDAPSLDPEVWFLSEDEITAARGGVPRRELSVYTSGNDVSTFSSTDGFFSSLYDDIESTGGNDTVYFTAWSVADFPFLPLIDESGNKTGFKALIKRAVDRGTDVRGIVWSNKLERNENLAIQAFMNNMLPAPTVGGLARLIFDDRLPTQTSSHHQKTFVLRRRNELVAYVGGIDPTFDRWDTSDHYQAELRRKADIRRLFDGWIDAHVRIKGPATKEVATNFLSRWNSIVKPLTNRVSRFLRFENPEYSPLPAIDASTPLDFATDKNHHVQIVRTFSCRHKNYEEYAPRGEKTILASRLKAIRNAKNFIYIEDQYFVLVPELLQALLEVLPRLQRLIVVVQRTLLSVKITGYDKYVFDMIAPIQRQFPNKFQLYTTKKSRNLYIHSKLVIIDDAYVSVGSANWNRRSMTSDSEINANIVDSEEVMTPDGIPASKLARDFRVRKFMEMTGRSYDEIEGMRFLDAANTLDVAANDPTTILDVLEVHEELSFVAFTDSVREKIDPDDKC
ncbi:hypothetical protein PINS_up014807 [Pythium insidiosum]|nr:hypothetical protein PINS_up014807 [Pythium insidiosum]